MDNEHVDTFDTVADAYRFLNKKNKGHIAQVCTNKRDSYLGYKWRYIYEN
jgi:hypothetical protein